MLGHEALRDHIRAAHGKPLVFSHSDCASFVADWVFKLSGVDVFAGLRGSYEGLDAKQRLTADGGLARLMQDIAARHGFPETGDPARGDVGLFMARDFLSPGICTGDGWVARVERGVFFTRRTAVVRAYRILTC